MTAKYTDVAVNKPPGVPRGGLSDTLPPKPMHLSFSSLSSLSLCLLLHLTWMRSICQRSHCLEVGSQGGFHPPHRPRMTRGSCEPLGSVPIKNAWFKPLVIRILDLSLLFFFLALIPPTPTLDPKLSIKKTGWVFAKLSPQKSHPPFDLGLSFL